MTVDGVVIFTQKERRLSSARNVPCSDMSVAADKASGQGAISEQHRDPAAKIQVIHMNSVPSIRPVQAA